MTRRCRSWLLALAASSPIQAAGAELTMLKPNGSTIKAGSYTIELGEADSAGLSFLGPLKITRGDGRSCTVDENVAIVTLPIAVAHESLLYVTTYSGSENRIYVVDAQNCKVRWTSIKFTGQPVMASNTLRLNEAGTMHLDNEGLPAH